MSKIYEALLQAEMDRLTPEEQEKYKSDPAAFPRTASILGRAQEFENKPSEPQTVRTHNDTAISLEVVQRTWQPRIDKLPTLQLRSAFAEQFRSLRSKLYEYRGFHRLKTVLVSSGMPKEGKTFVAANLALSLARYKNNRVLLIDGDLRRNSLHTLLGTSSTPGLSSFLASEANALEIMQRCDLDSEQTTLPLLNNVTFIPGGSGGDGAADLSGNSRFGELIQFASPYFDWIIVDSSPVNIVSDAVNLAPACDGVLLVTRAGQTPYTTVQRAQKEFATANLLGVVLNGLAEVPHQAYYGYGTETD